MKTYPCSVCAHPATSTCGGCKKLYYCSKKCQKRGWEKHKKLCKILQMDNPPNPNTYCGICGERDGPLTVTDCCKRTICDDEYKYVLGTFTQVSCFRNHHRYTICSTHDKEGHSASNWKDCPKCRRHEHQMEEMFVGQATSWHNFIDNKLENPPDFEPSFCFTCDKNIKLNAEGFVMAGREKMCYECYPVASAQKNAIMHLLEPQCLYCLKEERAGRKGLCIFR